MAFQSFSAGSDLLRLRPGARSSFIPFTEMTDKGPLMFLCVASTNRSFELYPSDSAPPRIRLRANDGLPVVVAKAPGVADIADDEGRVVASASWNGEAAGIFLVVVTTEKPDILWEIELRNADPRERTFTCTLASTEAEAHQPWIDMPDRVNFEEIGILSDSGKSVDAYNFGSATLTLSNVEFWSGSSHFEIDPGIDVIESHMCGGFGVLWRPLKDFPAMEGLHEAEIRFWSNAPNNKHPDGYHPLHVFGMAVGDAPRDHPQQVLPE